MAVITAARVFVCSVVAITFIYFSTSGAIIEEGNKVFEPFTRPGIPDFGHHVPVKTLSASDFPIDEAGRRVIIVGDIHGMYESFNKLLRKVSYDPNNDVLIHVGDILTKVPHLGSMQTLAFMASNNITGVRGNHDQSVIEWRGWMDWIKSLPGGSRWLETLVAKAPAHDYDAISLAARVDAEKNNSGKERERSISFFKMIPKGWKLLDQHFRVAYDMAELEYRYLLSLPLVLHVPSAHTFLAHAGLLSHNPEFPYTDPCQPLARLPKLHHSMRENKTELKRKMQEQAILENVPQNKVPWNILNMRSVVQGKISRKNKGTSWTTYWNKDMSKCNGFESTQAGNGKDLLDATKALLPCYPSTVIYGHTASRGLNPKRWSIGLDSGCVYGRRLTALILGANFDAQDIEIKDDEDDMDDGEIAMELWKTKSRVRFGDDGFGRIASVSCA